MCRLKYYRVKALLTQNELGRRCGFKAGQSRIAFYESGARTPPLQVAHAIVAALNKAGVQCTLSDVFPPEMKVKK